MDDVLKQSVISLLEEAKANIAAGKDTEAIEKIDAALSELKTENAETKSKEPEKPPLPGEGSNGPE